MSDEEQYGSRMRYARGENSKSFKELDTVWLSLHAILEKAEYADR